MFGAQCGAPTVWTPLCSLQVEPQEAKASGGSGSLQGAHFCSRRLDRATPVSAQGSSQACAHGCCHLRASWWKDLDLEETPVDLIQSVRETMTVWCRTGRECSLSDAVCQPKK